MKLDADIFFAQTLSRLPSDEAEALREAMRVEANAWPSPGRVTYFDPLRAAPGEPRRSLPAD